MSSSLVLSEIPSSIPSSISSSLSSSPSLSPSDSSSSTISPPSTTTQMSSTGPSSSPSSTTSTTSVSTTSSSMPPPPPPDPPVSTSSNDRSSTSISTSSTSTTSTSTSDTPEPPPTTTSSSTTDPPPTTTSSQPTESSTTSSFSPTTEAPPPPPPTSTRRPAPTSTFSSVVFVSTTDNRGSPTRTAPSVLTSTFTSTGTDGAVVTVTHIIANPSLVPNTSHSKGNGFFGNTGAVAAVFVLVGLAAASIALWIFFALRRRRRQRRIELDTALAAAHVVAAHRSPLGDDDDPHQPNFSASALEMSQRRSSSGLASTYLGPRASYHDDPDHPDAFNPYADFGYPAPGPSNLSKDGYAIARTSSPPVAYFNAPHDRSRRPSASGSLGSASSPEGYVAGNHSTTPSGASYEPLMASYHRQSSGSGLQSSTPAPTTPPALAVQPQGPPTPPSQGQPPSGGDRNPSEAHSMFTFDTTDDRLDPGLRRRQREAESASMKDLRDEEDYSRPVLGVRNLP